MQYIEFIYCLSLFIPLNFDFLIIHKILILLFHYFIVYCNPVQLDVLLESFRYGAFSNLIQ
jgi:hypothetical protein